MTSSYHLYRVVSTIAFILLIIGTISAQRPSVDELEMETLYIEATRAKLLGNNEEAITKYKKIIDQDDTNDVVYYELAKVYLSTKAPKEALDVIKKAVKLKPRNTWYQEELAAAHEANDDFISASKVYESLIGQQPGEEKFYYDLAFLQVKNNSIKEALSTFERHEKRFGVSEEVIGRKFNLYQTLENKGKAEEQLVKLTKAFPNELSYAMGLAKFYQDVNNASKAKSTYQKILKQDPSNTEAQVALNNLDSGKSQESDESLWSDANVNIDIKISKIIPAINGLEKAPAEKQNQIITIAKTIAETHPEEAKAFAVLGDIYHFSDQSDSAIEAYENALKLEKNIYSVWDQLLNLYKDNYELQKLYDQSEAALDYFPNEGSIYYLNGFAANGLGKYSDAMNSLMQADIMTKNNTSLNAKVKVSLGTTYVGLGKTDKAKPLLEEALNMGPDDLALVTEAQEAYINMSETMTKEELFMRGLKAQPNQWQMQYTQAKLAYNKGAFDESKALLEKMEAPKSAFHVLELLGDTLFQLGDVDGAVEQWKASKSAGNPNRNLSKKIYSRQI